MTNLIIDNPNVKLVPVDESESMKSKPKSHSIYANRLPGTKIHASDGTVYILQEDHSLRRAIPKVKKHKKKRWQ